MTEPAMLEEYDPPLPTPRRRWLRRHWRMVVTCALVLLIAGGEYAASRAVAVKLRNLVDRKLDARLETGSLLYVPPYGITAWGVRLIRNDKDLINVGKVNLRLAQLPLGGGPIV